MYLSILIFPLLASFVSGFLGRKIGITGAHILTCTCLSISSLLATIDFYVLCIFGFLVVSYLLINFYFTRIQANKAAILALTMNRVGDMGLSVGFFALFALFGSVDYSTIFSLAPFMNETAITIISLLLLMGAMAKSA